jgi:hypothetical protein
MENKVIITYSLVGKKKPLEITRKIYGYTEFSNNSKYKYNRKGILSDVTYEKLSKGCIMIDKKNEEQIIDAFKKLKLKTQILEINLVRRK